MRLVELDPHWTCDDLSRRGMGVSFDCPIHRNHRLAVAFANPVDGGLKMRGCQHHWHRTGETFDTLTLGPSIDASGFTCGTHDVVTPCWHGFIKNGAIE